MTTVSSLNTGSTCDRCSPSSRILAIISRSVGAWADVRAVIASMSSTCAMSLFMVGILPWIATKTRRAPCVQRTRRPRRSGRLSLHRRGTHAGAGLHSSDELLPLPIERAVLERVELDVGDRDQKQREEQTERWAADDGDCDRRAAGAADPEAERGRHEAGDDR